MARSVRCISQCFAPFSWPPASSSHLKKKRNDEIRYLFWRTLTGNNRGVNVGNRQLARTSPAPPTQPTNTSHECGRVFGGIEICKENSKVLVVLLVYEYKTTGNDQNISRYVQQERASRGDGTWGSPMLNSPPLAKLARLNGTANKLTMTGGSFLDSVSCLREDRLGGETTKRHGK